MATSRERRSNSDCINSSNPYHECVDYCFKKIAEAKEHLQPKESDDSGASPPEERTVHPNCINASNPYHECSEYCFRRIAEAKDHDTARPSGSGEIQPGNESSVDTFVRIGSPVERKELEAEVSGDESAAQEIDTDYPQMNERQKKLFELRLKMNAAIKANAVALAGEKNRMEAQPESRGISKQKWLDERKKKIGKLLDANGLEMSKAYMLDTQEMAEAKYKKWEKEAAPSGWDVFNQKTLYNAYKKRTKNVVCDMDAYNKAKEEDPEFYRNASSLQYGKAPQIPEENVDRMVKELQDREAKRKSFSRRRKFHDEKDIDSINDRNEHFNKKIERAFGKYTLEIKNNLERGTALPD